jgi:hypothetical protein
MPQSQIKNQNKQQSIRNEAQETKKKNHQLKKPITN